MKFELPKLDYAYNALEPNIDAKTMEIHHSKHHNGYTNNLNNALEGSPLNGKTIEESKDSNRMLGVIFTPDGNFSAYAGCNSMSGTYQLNEEISRISFSKITTTMMACADMLTEQELGKVLEITDNYNFDGKTFKLNKARMAPIAEFELIK